MIPFDIINLAQRNTFQQPFTEAGIPRSTPQTLAPPLSSHVFFYLPRRGYPIFVRTVPPCLTLVCLEEDTPTCGGASLSPGKPVESIVPTTVIGLGIST